jgi:hypothetical protein
MQRRGVQSIGALREALREDLGIGTSDDQKKKAA